MGIQLLPFGELFKSFWRAIQLAMRLAKPVQDKSAVLFGGISMRE